MRESKSLKLQTDDKVVDHGTLLRIFLFETAKDG